MTYTDEEFNKIRKLKMICADALTLNYKQLFSDFFIKQNQPNCKRFHYLSLDLEPAKITLQCLKMLPLDEYRFSVNLTGTIYDCALTGGTAWKCTPPSCNITGGTGGNSVYVYDTNTEVCCDPLYVYDAGFARIDNDTEVFLNGNCTGATGTCYECNDFVSNSYAGSDYHQYDPVQICNGLSTTTIEFYWYSIDRPNRFNLYDNTGLISTSGWVGFANYPGPWGSSLSTPSSGTIGALYTSDMYLLVEAGPADLSNPISDTWNGNFVCSNSCFQYLNEMGFNWVGDYQDCDGTWYYGAIVTPGNQVCAVAGSIFNISGTLTQTYSCQS